jgi:type IV pilus assembly protein PilA
VNKITKKFLNSFRAGESGFTLIELLIVIAILGILAAVIIPNVSKFVGSSKVAAANAELAQVQTAGQAAAAQNGGTLTAFGVGPGTEGALSGFLSGQLTGYYWIKSDGSVDETDASPSTGPSAVYSAAAGPWYTGTAGFQTSNDQFH